MDSDILYPATLIIAGIVVAVLAIYLILIAVKLYKTGNHLKKLNGVLVHIADDTEPLSEHLHTSNEALQKLHQILRVVDENLKGISNTIKL